MTSHSGPLPPCVRAHIRCFVSSPFATARGGCLLNFAGPLCSSQALSIYFAKATDAARSSPDLPRVMRLPEFCVVLSRASRDAGLASADAVLAELIAATSPGRRNNSDLQRRASWKPRSDERSGEAGPTSAAGGEPDAQRAGRQDRADVDDATVAAVQRAPLPRGAAGAGEAEQGTASGSGFFPSDSRSGPPSSTEEMRRHQQRVRCMADFLVRPFHL